MKVTETKLPGVRIFEPIHHHDSRGFVAELWNREFAQSAGLPVEFAQDNLSHSSSGCLRGLHFQYPTQQGKLVTVVCGKVFDVAVDIRTGSPTFGQWTGQVLDDVSHQLLWIPRGHAHGFLVLSDGADVLYRVDAPYRPDEGQTIAYNDPALAIDWPAAVEVINDRDRLAPHLDGLSALPAYQTDGR